MNDTALQERMTAAHAADAAGLKTALATEADLRQRLEAAIEAEEAAKEALEDAQLAAVQGGKDVSQVLAVPPALVQAVEEARRQRVSLEGAAAAFERSVQLGTAADQAKRRHVAEQRVQVAADAFLAAGQAFVAGLKKLMDKQGGALIAARQALIHSVATVPTSVLTNQGWVINEGLAVLRNTPGDRVVIDTLQQLLSHGRDTEMSLAHERGAEKAQSHFQTVVDTAVRAAQSQPADWPSA